MQKDIQNSKIGLNLSKWQKIVLVIINIIALPIALLSGALGALGEGGNLGFLLGFSGFLAIPNIILFVIYYAINLVKVLPNRDNKSIEKRIYVYTLLAVLLFNGILLFMELSSYTDGFVVFINHLILNGAIFALSLLVSFVINKIQKK